MKKKILLIPLIVILICVITACSSNDLENHGAEKSKEKNEAEHTAMMAEEERLYDEYNLLDFKATEKVNSLSIVHTLYEMQNKSDNITISNFSYDYIIVDDQNNEIENKSHKSSDTYPIKLDPREKAEFQIVSIVDGEAKEDWINLVSKYSYDMDGKRYTIDLLSKKAEITNIENHSNVDFNEKNILVFYEADLISYRQKEFENKSDVEIKTLEADIVRYDEQGIAKAVETVSVIELGEETIKGHTRGYVRSEDRIVTDDGSMEIVSYTYETGTADEDGYNRFEINLITKEARGSTNNILLDGSSENSNVDALSEFQIYTNTFGKKINETNFEVDKIEELSGLEWLYLEDTTLLDLSGQFVLIRDYDTLLIKGFRFDCDRTDESTQQCILNTLENAFGTEYETTKKDGEIDTITWNLEEYDIHFVIDSCIISVGTKDF